MGCSGGEPPGVPVMAVVAGIPVTVTMQAGREKVQAMPAASVEGMVAEGAGEQALLARVDMASMEVGAELARLTLILVRWSLMQVAAVAAAGSTRI